MATTDLSWIGRGRRREQVLLSVMNKPRMPFECREILGYKKGNKFDLTLKELEERNIARTIVKGLYGLTEHGQKLRKHIAEKKGIPYTYNEPRLDWRSYVWVRQGTQRMALLKVMQKHPMFVARLIRLSRQIHAALSRTDAYSILKHFHTRRLARELRDRRHVLYSITRKGREIKRQILLLWYAMFVFYIG